MIDRKRIKTTQAKAKALRPFIEKVITLAKKARQSNDSMRKVHYRRLAAGRLRDKRAAKQLFDDRVDEFMERDGGYTRIYKIGRRVGDGAEMALIEFIDASDEGHSKKPRRRAPKKKKTVGAQTAAAGPSEEAGAKQAAAAAADVEAEASGDEASADDEDSPTDGEETPGDASEGQSKS